MVYDGLVSSPGVASSSTSCVWSPTCARYAGSVDHRIALNNY